MNLVLGMAGFGVDMTGFGIRYDCIWCRMRLDMVLGVAGFGIWMVGYGALRWKIGTLLA